MTALHHTEEMCDTKKKKTSKTTPYEGRFSATDCTLPAPFMLFVAEPDLPKHETDENQTGINEYHLESTLITSKKKKKGKKNQRPNVLSQ